MRGDTERTMGAERAEHYVMDIGPMGPIGEGESLILRVARNCPWNRCLFCPVYKGKKFVLRSVDEIRHDIDAAARITEFLEAASWNLGPEGRITRDTLGEVIKRHQVIYGDHAQQTPGQWLARSSLHNVANWLSYGAKRVFLQDADALIMRPIELVEVLTHLKATFPTVSTVTSYARSKTCSQRTLHDLQSLHDAGLSWLFVGVESGCDEVLEYMHKGVTSDEHISGGQKVRRAGIDLAAFIMPGLADGNKQLTQKHVRETTRVLNEIEPAEVRIRSLAVIEGSPLFAQWESGEFEPPIDDQMIDEIRMLIEGLRCDCTIETLQMTNVLFNVKGRLFPEREKLLAAIARYQAFSPLDRARFRFNRYAHDGYLDYVEGWGRLDPHTRQLVQEAQEGLDKGFPDAVEKAERAIAAIKSKGIP
jgi:radical SAM superfamily enzyme YgiQ (UPF0313 family)